MTTPKTQDKDDDNDVAGQARAAQLFRRTPLIYSPTLSQHCQQDVYLKLDCLQASGSFKDRGVAHLCWTLQQGGCQKLICSSGGNAGLAVATVGKQLGMQVDVVIPTTTKALVVQKLQSLGAKVTIHGENWNAADTLARQWVQEQGDQASYISPYDNPLLWTGHSTMIDEIVSDLKTLTGKDDIAIGTLIVSVGGGGLLCGALEGLERHYNNKEGDDSNSNTPHKTTVIAAETVGASSFGQALEAGKLVRLPAIDSVATSLGALEVTPATLERSAAAQSCTVQSATCFDAEAVQACIALAQDHRLLVEPACGAALAVAYSERLRTQHLSSSAATATTSKHPIVIQVCGGSGVNLELLSQWKTEFGL